MTSHYFNQCWPDPLTHIYGTRGRWVKLNLSRLNDIIKRWSIIEGNSHTAKTASLYWDNPQIFFRLPWRWCSPFNSSRFGWTLDVVSNMNTINSLWPSNTLWCLRSWSPLVQVMVCCLIAPNHYLNQCWLHLIEILCHSFHGNIYFNTQDINPQDLFEIYTFKIGAHVPGNNELIPE